MTLRPAVLASALAFVATFLAGCNTEKTSGPDSAVSHADSDDTAFAGRSYAGDADRGKLIFDTNCATCHGAGGRSGGVGPSLIGEDQRQDLSRTIVWIENPDPPMPKLYPSPLTERDVQDLAAFVQSIR